MRILVRKCKKHKKVKKKNITFFIKIDKKTCIFSENPCAKMQKTQKSEKTIMFYMKNCKKEQKSFKNLWFFKKKHPGPRDPRIFWIFRFCGMCVGFAIYFAICV